MSSTNPAASRPVIIPIALILLGLLRLINLGYLDMQAWDEGLYAVRTMGVVKYGAWLDQSSVSIWGLYSAFHPPLYVWLSALSVELFGNTEFAHRFISVLFGALTLPIIYGIGRRLSNDENEAQGIGLMAALLFGLNPFVDFYARQGQFDTALLFFLALGVWGLVRGVESRSLKWSVVAGVAIGLGLMTKLFVAAGIPLLFVIWLFASRRHGEWLLWRQVVIASAVAFVIATPWHLMIVLEHGDGNPLFLLTQSQMMERFVTGIEGNTKTTEIFYYVNQLLVLFPLGVAWSLYGLGRALRRREPEEFILAIWFLFFFLVFTVMRTKLEFYTLPMLAPLAILGGREIVRAMRGELSKRAPGVLIGATAIAVAWSAQQEWRTGIKRFAGWAMELVGGHVMAGGSHPGTVAQGGLLLGLMVLGLLVGLVIWMKGLPAAILRRLALVMFVPALALSLYNFLVADSTRWDDGGKEVARFINQGRFTKLIAIGYETNPQLTWYLDGVDVGWRKDMSMIRIDPTGHEDSLKSWIGDTLAVSPASALVLIERDRLVRGTTFTSEEVCPPDWTMVMETRRYAVLVWRQMSAVADARCSALEDVRRVGWIARHRTDSALTPAFSQGERGRCAQCGSLQRIAKLVY